MENAELQAVNRQRSTAFRCSVNVICFICLVFELIKFVLMDAPASASVGTKNKHRFAMNDASSNRNGMQNLNARIFVKLISRIRNKQ